ncbi:MAG: ATP-dependent DNA helicase RecG [Bacteroidetes bacterium HGW-Bacteroidetes-17]|jgi:ATP-dependent DNA helicase RecG|nr:MAG: ATP-dependent DNA helicase RecG [Bacteroidetes bacterium HGW-Bacteroidetes-17]
MSVSFLDTPIEYLKGVGPQRAQSLRQELAINTFGDLINYFPFRYIDKSKIYKIRDISNSNTLIQLKGQISNIQQIGQQRAARLTANLSDDSGSIELVWFRSIRWIKESIKENHEYIVFGKPTLFNNKYNIAHPEIEPVEKEEEGLGESLQPYYNSSEKLKSRGLGNKAIGNLTRNLLIRAEGMLSETLSQEIINKLKLISREEALLNIHFPKDPQLLSRAQSRLKFEELFFIQLKLLRHKINRAQKIKGNVFSTVGKYVNEFYAKNLPFELTNAQKRVIKEIRTDLGSGKQMNRLLQGDVGSGKTLVALMAILIALDNGFQACIMAPTEILATQHAKSIQAMLNNLEVKLILLTGSTKTAERKIIHEQLQSGELNVLIGTHALIEDAVKFKTLGLVIIDEQHRFGVEQRAKLWRKNNIPPHILVMTATPIPRTLGMTLYGDLDFSVIDELPPGRKAIKTIHQYDSGRLKLFGFLKKQIKQGNQVYIVYPLINESEKLDLKDLMDGYESISRDFPLPEYAISIVHGKMKPAQKEYEMQRFIKGETQLMVSTTVIEVGIDIPNASVMVIENAERFGLSQLHQLRGRVGRGADQSYCILMSSYKLTGEGKKRLEIMVNSSDGFEIAEADLRLRGPGDLQGTQQSGVLDLKIADLIKDEKILKYARNLANEILDKDPTLETPANKPLKTQLIRMFKNKPNWGLIS